jgi:hypothetical protein
VGRASQLPPDERIGFQSTFEHRNSKHGHGRINDSMKEDGDTN